MTTPSLDCSVVEEGPASVAGGGLQGAGRSPGSAAAPDGRHTSTSSSSASASSQYGSLRGPRSPAAQRGKRLALGMGLLLVMSASWNLFDRRIMEGLMVVAPIKKAKANRSSSYNARNDDADGGPALLPWAPWERKAMTNGTCRPPSNLPPRCCVGTSSQGGAVTVSKKCLDKGTDPYDKVMARAADFLHRHTVPTSQPLSSMPPTDCDTCRLVEHLIANNFTLTFQGDSVMGQVFWGLECDLLRRGYAVSTQVEDHPHVEGLGWRYGLRQTFTFRIARPNRTAAGSIGDNHQEGAEATVLFRAMYRPILDMQQVATIADATDVLVFDHGLHYGPQESYEMDEFRTTTAGILDTVRNSNRTKLVAWKETTPQHYNTTGGHWADIGFDCVPITEGREGVHRAIVEKAAADAGYAKVVDATSIAPGSLSGGPSALASDPDLVVLPYREFLVPMHDLHGDECTHYCSSPYNYVPIWRSLRLAMDGYFS